MFYIKMVHNNRKTRHEFHSEQYARGILKASYKEHLRTLEQEPERYEIIGKTLSDNEYRISFRDKGRLYFLGRDADIKNVLYTGQLGRRVEARLA